jgi:hypothetical protein
VTRLKDILFNTSKRVGIIALFVLIIPFLHNADSRHQNLTAPKFDETWITVFVHGIMSVRPHLSINNFLHFMTDNIDNSLYATTVGQLRKDKYFYQNQAMLDYGLVKVNPYDLEVGNTPHGTAHVFENMYQYIDAPKTNNLYYTFGWNGLMSPSQRYKEGKKLFEALEKEVEELRKNNINPKIRVIGYSHGGNVSLNLGAAHQKDYPNSTLKINELFLLGTPIQFETDHLINDPVFEKVYHIYSTSTQLRG